MKLKLFLTDIPGIQSLTWLSQIWFRLTEVLCSQYKHKLKTNNKKTKQLASSLCILIQSTAVQLRNHVQLTFLSPALATPFFGGKHTNLWINLSSCVFRRTAAAALKTAELTLIGIICQYKVYLPNHLNQISRFECWIEVGQIHVPVRLYQNSCIIFLGSYPARLANINEETWKHKRRKTEDIFHLTSGWTF